MRRISWKLVLTAALASASLEPCENAFYEPAKYTCYDGFLCPVLNGKPTLKCGDACYNPSQYSCVHDQLVYPPTTNTSHSACSDPPTTQHLPDPPYDNYFYSDCHSATQVVVTSPQPDSNLTIIGPRLLVAWPAGNSGTVAFFAPQNGVNGSLSISLQNGTNDQPLSGIFSPPASDSLTGNPRVGISTLVEFNSSAKMTVSILGSIRTIRDFTEGPSLLRPLIQDAVKFSKTDDQGVTVSRMWLDNKTVTDMSFVPHGNGASATLEGDTLSLAKGVYNFTASFDYPQLTQLSTKELFNPQSQDVVVKNHDQADSVSFLSYTTKLTAGAWRFLTYFGRDSMISMLLMRPILSEGQGGAIEAVLAAVLERLNATDGAVCHEETIGDYATWTNLQNNITNSTAPGCTYQMIDSDFYLMPAMESYFLDTTVGQQRRTIFMDQKATTDFGNKGMSYARLTELNAERVMREATAFAQKGGQTKDNLVHLLKDQLVGEWRDSTYGIGGGRIPYDVNTALMPAALRSIAALSKAGFFPNHTDWSTLAAQYAQVWEENTLPFFEVTVPQNEARQLVDSYTKTAGYGFPSHSENITSDVVYHGLSLDGNNNQSLVKVMNTDDCFRLFLLTNLTQISSFVNQTANNIMQPYPVGLSNPEGILIANPAYGGDPVYAANWTNNAYHGTVVWGWPMAMLASGLEKQLLRCSSTSTTQPDFCADSTVHNNVLQAYNHLWDVIEANTNVLSNEVWTWTYDDSGGFKFSPLGALPPPPGLSPTESDIRQLWSLTFLAVQRNTALKQ